MSVNGLLLEYIKEGVENLLEKGQFENGLEFRPTQEAALNAYKKYLNNNHLKPEDKLKGFFDMPTGIGKTALFSAILSATHQAASHNNDHLKSIIVVPTVTLLNQTQQDLKDFAPHFANRVGLYGDGHKNLHNQITVMTYDAWYDLSAAGKIGSHNIDILISDEAHKGTSERRIENILNQYDDKQTAKIAFSATPHFDESKSVYATHGRQIFYRSIRDAILSGELASYIQSHRAVIRAMPTAHMITKEFSEAAFSTKAQYRKRLKQEAWNKFALEIFRDGVDEYTGDPLSDNQAGFFVDDTTQADNLAKMLNSDEALQAKAEALGMSGVAVSIHSKNRRRKHLLSEYKASKYMAIIGDEMFKEGFNHPPMKTVIDYAHGSVVDKGQILGRGAREWWNEKKQRYEGLVLIDTVAYIGSKIPTENTRLREAALKNAVSVKGILEDSFILGPRANISPQNDPRQFSKSPLNNAFSSKVLETGKNNTSPSPRKSQHNIFWDNPDIEYYSHTAEVYQLDTEVAKIRRENCIALTPERMKELSSLRRRKGNPGYIDLYKTLKNAVDEDLEKVFSNSDILKNILKGGAGKANLLITTTQWNAIISTLEDREDHVSSPEKMEFLNTLRRRKGNLGSKTLYKALKDKTEENGEKLFKNKSDIHRILVGNTGEGKRELFIPISQWNAAIDVLNKSESMIPLRQKRMDFLNALRYQKGNPGKLKLYKLLKNKTGEKGENLFPSEGVIADILSGTTNITTIQRWRALVAAIKEMDNHILLESKMIELNILRRRKGNMGSSALYKLLKDKTKENGEKLFKNVGTVENILIGGAGEGKRERFILAEQWNALAHVLNEAETMIPLRARRLGFLNDLRQRKGNPGYRTLYTLLKNKTGEKGEKLFNSSSSINTFLHGGRGTQALLISAERWNTLIKTLKSMPDIEGNSLDPDPFEPQ